MLHVFDQLLPAALAASAALLGAAASPGGGTGGGSGDEWGGSPFSLPGAESAEKPAEEMVRVRLLADAVGLHPEQTFHLAVVFDIEPHWHIYWRNPGDSGMPTMLEVKAPPGFVVGETLYPRPRRFVDSGDRTFGYEEQAVLFVPVKTPEHMPAKPAEFTVRADWLACKGLCMLGTAERSITLPPADRDAAAGPVPEDKTLLAGHRSRLPQPLMELAGASVEFDGSRLTMSGPNGEHEAAEFFPAARPGVTFGEPKIKLSGRRFDITTTVEINPANALGEPMAVEGLIVLGEEPDDPCYDFSIPLPGPEKE